MLVSKETYKRRFKKKTSYTEELSVKCDFLTRVEINVEEEGRYRKVLGNEALSEELGLQERSMRKAWMVKQ